MKKFACSLVLSILCATAFPTDIATWIAQSSRSDNGVIRNLIADSALEESLRFAKALAHRPDSFMQDIIEFLFDQHNPANPSLTHLEMLFNSVLESKSGPDLRAWVNENRRILKSLLTRLGEIRNRFLCAHLLSLLPEMELDEGRSILMSAANSLVIDVRKGNGYLPPGKLAEALSLCDVTGQIGEKTLLETVLSLVEDSKQPILIRKAARTARDLGRPSPQLVD